jgi:exopolyphosphatase/guanosine-5'-triphosphate,3'-diphosphate pyrophosphatase
LERRVESVLGELAEDIVEREPRMLVGTSGTLCDLARVVAIRRGDDSDALARSVNQLTVDQSDLEVLHDELVHMSSDQRANISGLESKRADLIIAGSTVLVTAMRLFGLEQMTVGEWALREGLVLDAIARHDPADWSDDPRAMRKASVLSLCRRCQWDEEHGRQVARLAVDLFDQTRRLHGMGPDERELLHHAALLHDIGEHVSIEGHHKHTAYLIQNGKLRGFAPDEVSMLASIGRFHRRSDPAKSFEPYAGLSKEDQGRVVRLTAILRVADGLDRGHSSVVESIDLSTGDGDLRLVAHARGDAELERWGLRRKAELLERVLGRNIECILDEHHVHTPPAEAAARLAQ